MDPSKKVTAQGAGSSTAYFNSTTKVKRRIPAGGELFKDYSDGW